MVWGALLSVVSLALEILTDKPHFMIRLCDDASTGAPWR